MFSMSFFKVRLTKEHSIDRVQHRSARTINGNVVCLLITACRYLGWHWQGRWLWFNPHSLWSRWLCFQSFSTVEQGQLFHFVSLRHYTPEVFASHAPFYMHALTATCMHCRML